MRGRLLSLLVLAMIGCGSDAAPRASSSAASSASAASTSSAITVTASSALPSASTPTKRGTRALARGRQLSKDGKWAEAMAAFNEAVEVLGGEGSVAAMAHAELGWAALNAGELDASLAATEKGLAMVVDPNVRAMMLYNRGRVREARKDLDAAKADYAASIRLRPNDTVRRRLESIGGEAVAAAAATSSAIASAAKSAAGGGAAPSGPPPICAQNFATEILACECLVAARDRFGLPTTEDGSCGRVDVEFASEGTPLLDIVRVSAGAESALWVLADVRGRLRPVTSVLGDVEAKKILTPVKSDPDLASFVFDRTSTETGKTVRSTMELFCLLGSKPRAPRCTLEIPQTIAELENGAPNSNRTVTFARSIKPDGTVDVKKQGGPDAMVPGGVLGPHALW
ncbi:MAG: tetratricopeptide repeat protein [Polyangiaceae bacterium]